MKRVHAVKYKAFQDFYVLLENAVCNSISLFLLGLNYILHFKGNFFHTTAAKLCP